MNNLFYKILILTCLVVEQTAPLRAQFIEVEILKHDYPSTSIEISPVIGMEGQNGSDSGISNNAWWIEIGASANMQLVIKLVALNMEDTSPLAWYINDGSANPMNRKWFHFKGAAFHLYQDGGNNSEVVPRNNQYVAWIGFQPISVEGIFIDYN